MPITVPAGLEAQRRLGAAWARWLDQLPRRFDDVLAAWALEPDGAQLWHGATSLLAPVRTAQGTAAVLKLGFDGDDESRHEAVTLQRWHGQGAVQLLAADPHRRALLLERLPSRDLDHLTDLEACAVVGGLYGVLHVPALPQLEPLSARVSRWLDELAAQPAEIPVPRRYREQARSLGRALLDDPPPGPARIIHGDLHGGNVLAAPEAGDRQRGTWLAIDPKPVAGDPSFEPAPMLWNRYDELAGDVRGGLRRRLRTLVEHGRLDEERARAWVVVRMVVNAHWSVQDAQRLGRDLTAAERAWITRCVTITKAVQD